MENKMESKRVSVEQINEIMEERFPKVVVEEWYGVEVEITRTLDMRSVVVLVDKAVGSCFMDDGEYVPELLDYVMKCALVSLYTNIELPDDEAERYEFIYGTDIIDFIYGLINRSQYNVVLDAIQKKIALKNKRDVSWAERDINKVADAFDRLREEIEGMFEGVSAEDVEKLASIMAEHGEIDEEKIMKAYMESDR